MRGRQSRVLVSIAIATFERGSKVPSYGIAKTNGSKKAAHNAISRWNDGVKRHTIYTCIGTQQDTWGMVNGVRSGISGFLSEEYKRLVGIDPPFEGMENSNSVPAGVIPRYPTG